MTWVQIGVQIGTFLYQNADGTYSFGVVPAAKAVNTCSLGNLDTSRLLVGWIHTHPNPGVGYMVEEFSGANGDGGVTRGYDVPGYLVAPSGTVSRLDPSWGGLVRVIPASDPSVSVVISQIY